MLVLDDFMQALKDFKHPSAFHTSNEAAKVQENNLSAKDSVYTQTDMFEGSSTGATCIEARYLNALFSILLSSPVVLEALDRANIENILE